MSKVRFGFVANSSSSSFVVITAGDKQIVSSSGYLEEDSIIDIDCIRIDIDTLIKHLLEAKQNGVKNVDINFGEANN